MIPRSIPVRAIDRCKLRPSHTLADSTVPIQPYDCPIHPAIRSPTCPNRDCLRPPLTSPGICCINGYFFAFPAAAPTTAEENTSASEIF